MAERSAPLEPTTARADDERRTTPVELLWDLMFAFALTRVTALLSVDLSWSGFGHAMLALALVWWAWSAFVWAANAHDPDSTVIRGALVLATALIFLTGLALPHAFGRQAILFAGTYAGVRAIHLAVYADASRRGSASLSAISGFAITVAIGMSLLLAGALLKEPLRVPLWVAAAAIDYAGPAWLTRDRLRRVQRVAVAHFAERYSLFIIICLGESIASIGIGASGRALTGKSAAAVSLALLITIGLWWAYFDRVAARAEQRLRIDRDPVITAADAYSYLHLVLVAGIIIFAVGAKKTVADVGASLPPAARLALCGGVALHLVGHAAFRLRVLAKVPFSEIAAAALCLVVFAAAGGVPAWAVAGSLVLTITFLAVWETVTEPVPEQSPPPASAEAASRAADPTAAA